MPNYQPHQYGDGKPVVTAPVPTATVIEVQDLIGLASNLPYPASAQAWDTNLATTQTNFAAAFLGVSAEYSRNGDTAPIKVNTAGVFEFDCAAATFELGQLVGPAKDTGNALLDRTVVAVGSEALSIGRVAKRYASNTTRVLVEIFSEIMQGKTA